MKQKVTIKVAMECESCRNKALKIASMTKGVISVAIEGDTKDKVVVTGEDVDTVCLGRMLRKKFRCVTVLTVEEVKPKKEEKPKCCTVCVVPPPCHPCLRCHRVTCEGKCKACPKCESYKCGGNCKACPKCESYKCEGECKACCRCGSYRCRGVCAAAAAVNVMCYGQCPPWASCPSCCANPPAGLCYRVVYDSNPPPDSCSIQ